MECRDLLEIRREFLISDGCGRVACGLGVRFEDEERPSVTQIGVLSEFFSCARVLQYSS
jgi:hypothetical protein